MTWCLACCTPSQNFLIGSKDELASIASIQGNNIPAMSHASTLTTILAPSVVFASFSVAQYSENDLQRILRTILDSKSSPAFTPAFVVTQQYKSSCKRLLKALFPDIYQGKTYIECHNFF